MYLCNMLINISEININGRNSTSRVEGKDDDGGSLSTGIPGYVMARDIIAQTRIIYNDIGSRNHK